MAPLRPLKRDSGQIDRLCEMNRDSQCDKFSEAPEQDEEESNCRSLYMKVAGTIDRYEQKIRDHCAQADRELQECKLKPQGAVQAECMRNQAQNAAREEDRLARMMMRAQDRLLKRERAAGEQRFHFTNIFNGHHADILANNFDPGRITGPAKRCAPADRNRFLRFWRPRVSPPAGTEPEAPIITELNEALKNSVKFRELAFTSASRHQATTKTFESQAKQFDGLVKRFASDPSMKNLEEKKGPSDITGTEQKGGGPQQQAGGPQGGGGGGSPGGGGAPSGSGPASGFDQGGGSNAGTPPSFNSAGTPRSDMPADKSNKVGKDPVSGVGSTTAERIEQSPGFNFSNDLGSGSGDSGLGASRGLASSGKGRSSSAASSSAPGGGGGAGAGGGGSSVPCLGKDCQQALSATGGQFSAAGSLGGGGGGGMDDSGALDSLFKSDEPGGDAGPGGDALASLEGEGGDLGALADGAAGGEMQAGGAGEIGSADGGDLFLRVRGMYTKAQKKGLVAGMLKKL
jgi:hypothetical protein